MERRAEQDLLEAKLLEEKRMLEVDKASGNVVPDRKRRIEKTTATLESKRRKLDRETRNADSRVGAAPLIMKQAFQTQPKPVPVPLPGGSRASYVFLLIVRTISG